MRLVFALALVGCKSTSTPTEETGSATPTPPACDIRSWYPDADGDGVGDANAAAVEACEAPDAHVEEASDCDDTDAAVRPDAPEVCDAVDNNCDGAIDEGLLTTFFPDDDEDGVGAMGPGVEACEAPASHVASTGDCDDTDSDVSPDVLESCDGIDNNCDGAVDEGVQTAFYDDDDDDGFGDPNTEVFACQAPSGHVTDDNDCNDAEPASAPGLPESCDGIDNNCDGVVDEGVQTAFYDDDDDDGFGDPSAEVFACQAPSGHVTDDNDCNDAEPASAPGLPESCDGIDNNCDGVVDEGVQTAFYDDSDGDGFGDPNTEVLACDAPADHLTDSADCDDDDASIFPGAPSRCDGVDSNCSGGIEELRVPADYADLQAAIDIAVDGDRICLQAGTHLGSWNLGALAVVLEGEGAGATLDADHGGRVLRSTGSAGLELRNLDLVGGSAAEGGGLHAQNSIVTLVDVTVEDNQCHGECKGAGLFFRNGIVEMNRVVVQNNTFTGTDTELVEGVGVYARNTTLAGERVDLLGNRAIDAQYIDGVGFSQHNGSTVLHDLVIADNEGTGLNQPRGAAVRVYQGAFEAVDALIQNNTMHGDTTTGGPLVFVSSGASRLENALVIGNTTTSDNSAFGGGIYLFGHTLEVSGSTFADNLVDGASQSYGLSAQLFPNSTLDVHNTDFSGNTGTNGVTGQFVVQDSTFVAAYSNFFPDSFHLVASPVGTDGNLSVDPSYNAAYEPQAGLIDVGDPDILDADGTRSDIGYSEP